MSETSLKEMETLSSNLFHNILNPLTVLSLQIDDQFRRGPNMQRQIDAMIHHITHLEYFVSLLCENITPTSFEKKFSVNEEIESALEITSYRAKKNNIQVLSLLLQETSLQGNQLQFHKLLLDLMSIFMNEAKLEENFDIEVVHEKKIEILLEKRKRNSVLIFSVTGIPVHEETLQDLRQLFEYAFDMKGEVFVRGTRAEITLRFSSEK